MIDPSFINDEVFQGVVFYVLSYGLIAWFMGWGVSFLLSTFIKILQKGV